MKDILDKDLIDKNLQPTQTKLISINPATGESIDSVPKTTKEDYEKIILRAEKNFLTWRMKPAPQRGEIIRQIGEALRQHANISFAYLPTIMNQNIPSYTYRLEPGITEDRHGMMIIENEGILEIILS